VEGGGKKGWRGNREREKDVRNKDRERVVRERDERG
jgi:hypothetical protein